MLQKSSRKCHFGYCGSDLKTQVNQFAYQWIYHNQIWLYTERWCFGTGLFFSNMAILDIYLWKKKDATVESIREIMQPFSRIDSMTIQLTSWTKVNSECLLTKSSWKKHPPIMNLKKQHIDKIMLNKNHIEKKQIYKLYSRPKESHVKHWWVRYGNYHLHGTAGRSQNCTFILPLLFRYHVVGLIPKESKTLSSRIIINHDHPITLSSNLTKRSNKELEYYCGWTVVPECHMNSRNWGLQQSLAYKKTVSRKGSTWSTEPTDNHKKRTIANIRIWNSHGFQNTCIFKPFKNHHVICIVFVAFGHREANRPRKTVWTQCDCKAPIIHRRTVDGQNPAPPRMMIIPLFIGF